jgi:hypothetical protein
MGNESTHSPSWRLTVEEKWEKLLNPIDPLFKGMIKEDDKSIRAESLHPKIHVQASKKIIE